MCMCCVSKIDSYRCATYDCDGHGFVIVVGHEREACHEKKYISQPIRVYL